MRSVLLEGFDGGRDLTVVLAFTGTSAEGKFVYGAHASEKETSVLAFDPAAEFHREIAARYRIRPRGGGYLRIDVQRRIVSVSGRSKEFGEEPDRGLTLRALREALPGYAVSG